MTKPYAVKLTAQFRKDLKRLTKQGKSTQKLQRTVDTLIAGSPLGPKYIDHALGGQWKGFRDCHIEPDWVLIYKLDKKNHLLILVRSGSHSELEL